MAGGSGQELLRDRRVLTEQGWGLGGLASMRRHVWGEIGWCGLAHCCEAGEGVMIWVYAKALEGLQGRGLRLLMYKAAPV